MKKVISIILALTLLFSFFVINASAATKTDGTIVAWAFNNYNHGTYMPKSGWAWPHYYSDDTNYAIVDVEFRLDNYNVSCIKDFNNGEFYLVKDNGEIIDEDKNLFLTIDVTSIRTGLTDQMSVYQILTNLPNPKKDLESDGLGTREEESEVTALGTVEAGVRYSMYSYWEDFRNGDDSDAGRWEAQFAMSGKYVRIGNLWIKSLNDYNNVYQSTYKASMYYNKNGGVE